MNGVYKCQTQIIKNAINWHSFRMRASDRLLRFRKSLKVAAIYCMRQGETHLKDIIKLHHGECRIR